MASKVTKAQEKEYIDKKGILCPYCGKDQVKAGSPELGDSGVDVPVECLDCGKTWTDLYTLSGILETEEDFVEGKKITPADNKFLYYVAGDDVCTTSRGYSDSDEAVDAFAEEYPERPRGATHCIGVTKEKDGQREGMTVWEG